MCDAFCWTLLKNYGNTCLDVKPNFDDNASMPQVFVVHIFFTFQHNLLKLFQPITIYDEFKLLYQ